MSEECLICGAPLRYLTAEEEMTCAICGKKQQSRAQCVEGHFVCDECHTAGMDSILSACLKAAGRDPIAIMETLMNLPFCHTHGPEHHVMVGAAILTACRHAGSGIDLPKALREMTSRGRQVPGGTCGFWGACGAGVSTGIAVALLTHSTPLKNEEWGLANRMTARALGAIGAVGGPRCCKRDSYLAIREAVGFLREELGLALDLTDTVCTRFDRNEQCVQGRCPFHP